MPSSDALIVFAKVPRPDEVKTRLVPVLRSDEAAQLYEAFLHDALRAYASLRAQVRLYLAGSVDALSAGLVPDGVTLHRQQGPDLGARMQQALLETFAAGSDRVVVIGTDHPTLPLPFVRHAFVVLDEPLSISIGPAEDGGYYLLGMNDFFPGLFDGMTYSHAGVFDETLQRATETGARLTVLPRWYDVDAPSDLDRLAAELADNGEWAPRTRRVLRELGRLES